MRIVFAGSAELGCRTLEALLAMPDHSVAAIVCQPARPKGRSLRVGPCPVEAFAASRGVPVLTPARINDDAAIAGIAAHRPELIVVVAYGQILKPALLQLPPYGCINLHASLLPAYRGAAPIQWAIARGETETGVTVMHMNERMDAGDIISQARVPIGPAETAGELHDRLAAAGAEQVVEAVRAIAAGRAARTPQRDDLATLAPKLRKDDGRIDWTLSARDLYNRVRAFNPWPVCFCLAPGPSAAGEGRSAPGMRLRVLRAAAEDAAGAPGTVIEAAPPGPLVAAGVGALRLLTVQPEGRRPLDGPGYLNGYRLRAGERME